MEPTSTPTTLDYITALGACTTPLLLAALGLMGWVIRNRLERIQELERQLHSTRIEIYQQILEPFIILLTPDQPSTSQRQKPRSNNNIALEKLLSIEYKKVSFKLALIGSDNVVRAYNELLQFFYQQSEKEETEQEKHIRHIHTMALLGTLLLEIRRSAGNEQTKIGEFEILEWLIKDIRKYSAPQHKHSPKNSPHQDINT